MSLAKIRGEPSVQRSRGAQGAWPGSGRVSGAAEYNGAGRSERADRGPGEAAGPREGALQTGGPEKGA